VVMLSICVSLCAIVSSIANLWPGYPTSLTRNATAIKLRPCGRRFRSCSPCAISKYRYELIGMHHEYDSQLATTSRVNSRPYLFPHTVLQSEFTSCNVSESSAIAVCSQLAKQSPGVSPWSQLTCPSCGKARLQGLTLA
jgi:hypothetical protein